MGKKVTIYGVDAFIERLKALDMRPIVKIEASFRKGELYIKMFDQVGDEYSGSYVPSEESYNSKTYKKQIVDYLMFEFGQKGSVKLQQTEAKLVKKTPKQTPKLTYDKETLKKWVDKVTKTDNFWYLVFNTPKLTCDVQDYPYDVLFDAIDAYATISLKAIPNSAAEEFSITANDKTDNIIDTFSEFKIK